MKREDLEAARRALRWRAAALVCILVTVAAAVWGVYLVADYLGGEHISEEKMELIRQSVNPEELLPSPLPQQAEVSEAPEEETEQPEPTAVTAGPYAELFEQNEDMAAWLTIEGTRIDYPVMQTMEDEQYYLRRDFYGNADTAGCLILDTDSSLEGSGTTNLIIHGHNMKAGTMFGELDKYESEEYYSEHKYMELYTKTEKRSYEVIAVFYSQVYYSTDKVFKYYQFFQAEEEAEFRYFYDNIKELSLYDTQVTAELGDHFLTLSTCAYHVEDGRFVVVARETGREDFQTAAYVCLPTLTVVTDSR